MRYLIGALCAVALVFGAASSWAAAATVGCGRVTTFVAPDSGGALDNGDGWMIFAKPDGSSEKVIIRSGRLTPTGSIGGYVCIAIDGLYFDGVLAPGTTGYIPEPANWVTGTGVYCGTVGVNPFTSGQMSGPRTLQLRGALSAFGGGVFSVPASIALPTVGSYLCGRFEVGGPSVLVAVLRAGEPGYMPAGLPNTSTTPEGTIAALGLAGLVLVAGLGLLGLRARRSGRVFAVAALLTLVLASCVSQAEPMPTGSPSATPTAAATPAPTPTRTPSTSVHTTAVPAIPKDFIYVESSPVQDATLWLVDLSGAVPPAPVARWTGGSGSFAASRDGNTIIILSPGPSTVRAVHLVRPLTGEATILFEGPPNSRAFYPHLSPDGTQFAFTLLGGTSDDGLIVGNVSTGATRRLVVPTDTTMSPYGWSDDAQWLAYFRSEIGPTGGACCTVLENVQSGQRHKLGVGYGLSWRASEPRLLGTIQDRTGNQGAFGTTFYTFDLAQAKRTDLFSIAPRVTGLAWNPVRDEFLYVQETVGCNYHGTLWTRAVGGIAKRIGSADTVQNAWWSADGLTIYALVRGEGPDSPVIEASSGRRIAVIPNDAPRACP